ncbi:hypothetical protein AK95_04350 [Paenibacillus sp. LC231]|uniref:hypothetical protein n=1 Tax=Paenibacillus sp. LC231 TaxID=1120679 RepID=UPI0008DC92D2|nr:hypothetical protein [Paenibacillus sp. LC231]OIB02148.1 hypothetical protein AK95_04350 [Paenibacillus sp. LC231]
MKKRSLLVALVMAVTFSFGSIVSASEVTNTHSSSDSLSTYSFESAANSYFTGYVQQNISETAKVSGEDYEKLERQFELNKDNPLKNYKISQIDDSNPQNISFSVELTYDDLGTLPPVPYEAELVNGSYKIEPVENVIVDMDPESSEYRSVVVEDKVTYASDEQNDNGSEISPYATLSYYAGDFIYENELKFFNTSLFDTTKGSVTIIGWQQSNLGVPTEYVVALRYTIATTGTSGQIIKLGNAVQVPGEYKKDTDRFTKICTSITNGKNRALLVENKGTGNVKFAGNTYE